MKLNLPRSDESQLIIYDYDEYFVRAYDLLLENVAEVFAKHKYWSIQAQDYLSLHVILELLVDKLRHRTKAEDFLFEDIYETFPSLVCQDLVEVMANFLNLELYPYGLREIVSTLPSDMYPVDVVFDQESNGTYYLFDI